LAAVFCPPKFSNYPYPKNIALPTTQPPAYMPMTANNKQTPNIPHCLANIVNQSRIMHNYM